MIRVFKSDVIGQQLGKRELEQLAADFKHYKETGIPAACFGRDVPYDHQHTLSSVRNNSIMSNLAIMAAKFRAQF